MDGLEEREAMSLAVGTGEVLAVDLDGTLVRSDMMYESFWSGFGRDWRVPFGAMAALMKGRAALKRYLAGAGTIDVTTLPYDVEVIAYVERWRAGGGRAALVTASDMGLAQAVAAHLGIFDEVHGSDGVHNLKGEGKAQFLEERFGKGGFAYVGDSRADLAVWKRAAKAVTVNAPAGLRREAEAICGEVEHLSTAERSLRPYFKALRPHQWLKNVLIFLPMLAGHDFGGEVFARSLLAFVAFSLVASCVYVVNDLLDLAADRAHPRKRNRPFASGRLPIGHGLWMAGGLIVVGVAVAGAIGVNFIKVLAGYFLLTTSYSLYLKRQMVLDIVVLAGLYTVRIVAGGVATGIPLSVWLLAFASFLFLAMAAVKRQAELVDLARRDGLKASGRGYHVDDLPIISMLGVSAGYMSVLVLQLYVNSPEVSRLYPHPAALWGVSAVLLYWVTRTVLLTHRGEMRDDPVVYAATDRISQVCFAICAAFIVAGALP